MIEIREHNENALRVRLAGGEMEFKDYPKVELEWSDEQLHKMNEQTKQAILRKMKEKQKKRDKAKKCQ